MRSQLNHLVLDGEKYEKSPKKEEGRLIPHVHFYYSYFVVRAFKVLDYESVEGVNVKF